MYIELIHSEKFGKNIDNTGITAAASEERNYHGLFIEIFYKNRPPGTPSGGVLISPLTEGAVSVKMYHMDFK